MDETERRTAWKQLFPSEPAPSPPAAPAWTPSPRPQAPPPRSRATQRRPHSPDRKARVITWLVSTMLLGGALLIGTAGDTWAARSPLLGCFGFAPTYCVGEVWFVITGDGSVLDAASGRWGSFDIRPYQSAIGLMTLGALCLAGWRYLRELRRQEDGPSAPPSRLAPPDRGGDLRPGRA
jgi:hypothetical protein